MGASLGVGRGVPAPDAGDGEEISFEELLARARPSALPRHVLRYGDVRLRTHRLEVMTRPLATAAIVRLLGRGECRVEDEHGASLDVTPLTLARLASRAARDAVRRPFLLRRIEREVEALRGAVRAQRSPRLDLSRPVAYLRTDLWYGVRSGGSVGHIAGVANEVGELAGGIEILTTDHLPGVRPELPITVVPPPRDYWDFRDLPSLAFNDQFVASAHARLRDRPPAFVYQRYSVNNYAGVRLARELGVPLVLEYNGSGVWIGRNWGEPLRYERLSEAIELLNLHAADLVVVNSAPMRDELLGRGVDAARVLVNPNGVDPERYRPDIDGRPVRLRHGLEGKTVIGFIGTFGPWHGAEVLAGAFVRLLRERPGARDDVRLLLIGDGTRLPAVRGILEEGGAMGETVFAGMVPQEEGPAYLAACDLLASPHVPNPDGTPFFGSPTKLFEYMATGRAIVASRLDQIGEILEHGRTGWLVEPGSAEALATGLARLLDDAPLRERLGAAAREEAVGRHSWREHTRRIVARLRELSP